MSIQYAASYFLSINLSRRFTDAIHNIVQKYWEGIESEGSMKI